MRRAYLFDSSVNTRRETEIASRIDVAISPRVGEFAHDLARGVVDDHNVEFPPERVRTAADEVRVAIGDDYDAEGGGGQDSTAS